MDGSGKGGAGRGGGEGACCGATAGHGLGTGVSGAGGLGGATGGDGRGDGEGGDCTPGVGPGWRGIGGNAVGVGPGCGNGVAGVVDVGMGDGGGGYSGGGKGGGDAAGSQSGGAGSGCASCASTERPWICGSMLAATAANAVLAAAGKVKRLASKAHGTDICHSAAARIAQRMPDAPIATIACTSGYSFFSLARPNPRSPLLVLLLGIRGDDGAHQAASSPSSLQQCVTPHRGERIEGSTSSLRRALTPRGRRCVRGWRAG